MPLKGIFEPRPGVWGRSPCIETLPHDGGRDYSRYVVADWFADLLAVLEDDRRAHLLAAGLKAAEASLGVAAGLRSDLVTAATLHDIGYAHSVLDFHPLDGAAYLADLGFSSTVCHLVAHHSASTVEAEERGIDLAAYARFSVSRDDLGPAHAVLWWADLTTGPHGQDMTVEERLDDIAARYGSDHVVARSARRARPLLLAAGQSPIGSIQVPC